MTEPFDAAPRLAEAKAVLFGNNGAPPNVKAACALIQAAANEGSATAMMRCAVFASEGFGRRQDWNEAFDLLARAAGMGEPSAQRQLQFLADDANSRDWVGLRKRVNIAALLQPPPLLRINETSMIAVARGFAPPGFSEWLIERARDRLEPTPVNIAQTGEIAFSEVRTATSAGFEAFERDFVCTILQERAARLCGLSVNHHEPPSVISYEPGQHYGAHFDFLPPKLLATNPAFGAMGQRAVTFVTYLNEDFSGGATRFTQLNLEFRGKTGDALAWSNVLPDGSPDRSTQHAGLPVESGRKWVLSQWIRSRPQGLR